MKLKRFKLLSKFRGLPNGYEINFNKSFVTSKNIEPICLVGLNGSGKSNALEFIAEMFYYLENFNRSTKRDLDNFKSSFGFELEYFLPKITLAGAGFTWSKLEDLTFLDLDENQLVKIDKKPSELPEVSIMFNEKVITIEDLYNNGLSKVLPYHIIGYSSGFNDLLSNPFIKINFNYYNDLKKKINKPVESKLEMNRFQFLDYNISKLITIANFIFDADLSKIGYTKDLSILKENIKISSLNRFTIHLSLKKPKSYEKYLPDELVSVVEKFKEIDTLFEEKYESKSNHDSLKLFFDFTINEATIAGFRDKFLTADRLFNALYFFQILNIENISRNISKEVLSPEVGTTENLSDLIPKYEIEKQVFHLGNISFKKNEVDSPIINYKHFSDGEHQLLQILGSVILLDSTSTLFLFDEPETHFNPEWRSKLIWLINECLKNNPTEYTREQELVLSTHSPFLISDSKKNNVVWLKSDKIDCPEEVIINTYGASIGKLTSEFFGKNRQIADKAWNEMLNDLESEDITELNDSLSKYGESHERNMILQKLNKIIIEKGLNL